MASRSKGDETGRRRDDSIVETKRKIESNCDEEAENKKMDKDGICVIYLLIKLLDFYN